MIKTHFGNWTRSSGIWPTSWRAFDAVLSSDVKGKLGKYALSLGDGILIHGTDDPRSIGRRVSHGCIRVPDAMIEKLYNTATIGTDVFIFDSQKPAEVAPASDIR